MESQESSHSRTSLISQDIISSKDFSHLTRHHLIHGLLSSQKASSHPRASLNSQDIISSTNFSYLSSHHLIPGLLSSHKTSHPRTLISEGIISSKAFSYSTNHHQNLMNQTRHLYPYRWTPEDTKIFQSILSQTNLLALIY
jgi:hypothetical protein